MRSIVVLLLYYTLSPPTRRTRQRGKTAERETEGTRKIIREIGISTIRTEIMCIFDINMNSAGPIIAIVAYIPQRTRI